MTPSERTLNISLCLMVPICLLAVVWAVFNFPFDQMNGGLALLTLVTVFFSAYFRIEIPRAKLHLTISDGLVFLSLLFYGGGVAVLLRSEEHTSELQSQSN